MLKPATKRLPAFLRVSQIVKERIEQGYYTAGEWLPTERDLAEELDVSRPVVRAALGHLQQQRLIVREIGCRPRVRSPVGSLPAIGEPAPEGVSSQSIAIVMGLSPGYVSAHAILRGISTTLRQKEAPHQLVVCDTHSVASPANAMRAEADWERVYLERIEDEGAAGIILWYNGAEEMLPILRRIQQKGIPVVLIDRFSADFDCDFVGVDNRAGVKEAVDYLLGLGHRRIAYITNPEKVSTVQERLKGYREALEAHGIPVDPELIRTDLENQRDILTALFSLAEPPTALVAVNDFTAFMLLREAQALGIRVPEDLSVIGFDDIEAYSPHPAVLTSIHQPFYRMGQRAAELLLRRQVAPETATRGPFQHLLLPTSLVVRSTCKPLRKEG